MSVNGGRGDDGPHAVPDPRDAPDAVGGLGVVGAVDAIDTGDAVDQMEALESTILDWVQDLYATNDPVPQDLLARVDFAMDPLGPDDEVALLQGDLFDAVGVRGGEPVVHGTEPVLRSAEHSRTVTFDSESLTISIQASPSGEAVRVDGWLAPPAVRHIKLRAGDCELHTDSDELGGFVLPQVPHGLMQVIVEAADADPPQARTVVTTAVLL